MQAESSCCDQSSTTLNDISDMEPQSSTCSNTEKRSDRHVVFLVDEQTPSTAKTSVNDSHDPKHLFDNRCSVVLHPGILEVAPSSKTKTFNSAPFRQLIENGMGKHRFESLRSIVRHLFVAKHPSKGSDNAGEQTCNSRSCQKCLTAPLVVHQIVHHPLLSISSLVLMLYTLYAAELNQLYGSPTNDPAIAVCFLAVSLFFLVELCLLSWTTKKYFLKGNFWLDAFALVGLFGDTLLMLGILESDEIASDKGARLVRASRNVRVLVRLIRSLRFARIAGIFPRLHHILGRRQTLWSELLQKRLWRIFCFLDKEGTGQVSKADAFLCRSALLRELQSKKAVEEPSVIMGLQRPPMKKEKMSDSSDSTISMEDTDFTIEEGVDDPFQRELDFKDFVKEVLFPSTGNSKAVNLEKICLAEVEKNTNPWIMTRHLAENNAIKVCLGVLLLLVLLPLGQPQILDHSARQALSQLDAIDLGVQQGMLGSGSGNAYMCDHMEILARRWKVLYLGLNHEHFVWESELGSLYCKEGNVPSVYNESIHEAVDEMLRRRSDEFRVTDVVKVCYPDTNCNPKATRSLALLDVRTVRQVGLERSLIMTSVIVFLIAIIIVVFQSDVQDFSRSFIDPLCTLSDDINAMSLMELVEVNASYDNQRESRKVVEEMLCLRNSFDDLCSALRSWANFVPPSVAFRLFSAGVEADIGVSQQNVTVLFCDISEFESVCQTLSPNPTQLLELLSTVLGCVATCVENNGGTLLEFINDEVLAVFGAPKPQSAHPVKAMTAMLQIHEEIAQTAQCHAVKLRCAVHTADVLIGNIGASNRMKYGVLGDGVNLTARIKGLNSRYCTSSLASQDAIAAAAETQTHLVARPLDLVVVKGKTKPMTAYEVLGIGEDTSTFVVEAVRKHTRAFEHYLERRFSSALEELKQVGTLLQLNGHESDEPSRMLSARCKEYALNPPSSDWDGAERLTQKTWAAPKA
eukprot:gnl/MRDRNA2_/MRDRNA2_146977_c0_seq1.p1 gnl/MRDRNA2_/MRDRNA2_146977_c0~~gnl/MRDRNA2_/MRDRNA2_146977_c0_seq1.p1  ORF type:complete len:972 (-),score=173.55 gnl/MRDRNA2_/MRDRNA2_146977_c0_seq1:134-3049(-)